jgi:hypothetical protein
MPLMCIPIILVLAIVVGVFMGRMLRVQIVNKVSIRSRLIRKYCLTTFLLMFVVVNGIAINGTFVAMVTDQEEFCEDRTPYDSECSNFLDTIDSTSRLLLPPPIRPHICFVGYQPICRNNKSSFGGEIYDLHKSWFYYLLMLSGGLLASLTCYVVLRNYGIEKKKKR